MEFSSAVKMKVYETVAAWCEAYEIPIRSILDLDQLWHLATAWYENRLIVESRRPAPDKMAAISTASPATSFA